MYCKEKHSTLVWAIRLFEKKQQTTLLSITIQRYFVKIDQ